MELYTLRTVFILGSILQTTLSAKYDEPMCTSRFDFEEKLLDKLVRMEHAAELLQERVNLALTSIEQEKLQMKQDFTSVKDDISRALTTVEQEKLQMRQDFTSVKDDISRAQTTVEQEKLQMKHDFTSFQDDIRNEQTNALAKIEGDVSTNENKLERMLQDLVRAMNKSANDKG